MNKSKTTASSVKLTLLLTGKGSRDGTDNDLRGTHDDTTDQEDRSTTHLVDSQDSGERHGDVDGGQDDDEDEDVVDSGVSSKDGSVRKVKVDTRELLTSLDETTDHGPPGDSVLVAENFGVTGFTQLGLLLLGDPHLLELERDLLILGRQVSELGQVDPSLLPIASTGEVGGRLGREDETDEEQTGPDKGETDRKPVGDVTGMLGHSVGGTVDQEDTAYKGQVRRIVAWFRGHDRNSPKSNVQLEGSGDHSSESGRTGLGLEDGDQTGGGSDSHTGQQSSDTDLTPFVESRDFDGDTDHVDDDKGETSSSKTVSTTKRTLKSSGRNEMVSAFCYCANGKRPLHRHRSTYTAQSAQEGSDTEDTSDGRLTSGGKRVVGADATRVVGVASTESSKVGGQLVKTRGGRVLPTKDHSCERLEET